MEGLSESGVEIWEALRIEDEWDIWIGTESKYVEELVVNASGVMGAQGVSGDSRNGLSEKSLCEIISRSVLKLMMSYRALTIVLLYAKASR